MTIDVSVVVPTYRRPELIRRCLAALLAQQFDAVRYEIIVVDDEPSALTRAAVEAMANPCEGHPDVRYIPRGTVRGPAAARNTGIRAARGAVIAFTDDDCIAAPDWIAAGSSAMATGFDGLAGRIVVPTRKPPTDYERTIAGLEDAPFATANCFYRASVLRAVGGFDERFATAWREDSDLEFRVRDAGFRLGHRADAVVTHPVRQAPWGVSVREQWKSQFNALLYRKHPRRYRERVERYPNIRYLSIIGSLVFALAAAVLGHALLALLALSAWALQTVAFAAKRLHETSRRPGHVAEMLVTSMVVPPLSLYWRLRGALRYRVLFI